MKIKYCTNINISLALVLAILLPAVTSAATLNLSPSSRNINTGETFFVTVNLDTQGVAIDGVDLRYLNYNPSMLQLLDSNVSVAGVQIAPGNLMPMTLVNNVDATNGRVNLSQVAGPGNKYTGSGILATLTFRALSSGVANVTLNHTYGNTTDANVASAGKDVLTSVVNGTYTITGSSVTSAALTGPFTLNSSGSQVTLLQQMLIRDGVYPEAIINGFYGLLTQAATKRFQQKYGIEQTGIAGPQTRAKLNALYGGVTVETSSVDAGRLQLIQQIKLQLIELIRQLISLLQAQLTQISNNESQI